MGDYLIKRNGVFHFHMRIPVSCADKIGKTFLKNAACRVGGQ